MFRLKIMGVGFLPMLLVVIAKIAVIAHVMRGLGD